MPFPSTIFLLRVMLLAAGCSLGVAVAAPPLDPIITADYQKLVSAADVDFTGLTPKSYHGMPIGTGEMGSLVWNSGSSALKFQINRTDVFGCNNAVTAVNGDVPNDEDVTKVVSDFGYGCGFVTVDVGGAPFSATTKHHLSLYDGKLTIAGNGVNAEIIAGVDADAFVVKIKDTRSAPQEIRVDLTLLQKAGVNLRPPYIANEVIQLGETAESLLAKGAIKPHYSTLANGSAGTQIWLTQKFEQEAATEFRELDHYSGSSVVIDVSGRSATVTQPTAETIRLTLPAAAGEVSVYIASAATLNKTVSVDQVLQTAKDHASAAKATGYDAMYAANQVWWQDFWGKSYVFLPADETTRSIQKKWSYYLYLMASSTRGQYPARFGGNIWSTNGTNFGWGSMFWGFNEEPMQHSYEAANHGELQDATLRMNLKNYESYKTLARQQWIGRDTEAIFIEETRPWNGPEKVPDSIASDLLACTTPDGAGPMTPALTLFGLLRHYHDSRWQMPSGWTGLNTIGGSEKAEHYWERYLYTKDLAALNESYKMIKGAAEFYRNTPHLKLEADGYYHHYKSNLHEHIYGAKDVVCDLAFIRGVMTAAIHAAELLNVDATLRADWQNIIDKLTPYALGSEPDALGVLDHTPNKATWAQARRPVINGPGSGVYGAESPRLTMLENFDVLTLETLAQASELLKTQPTDPQALKTVADWTLANNTFEEHPGYRLNMEGLDWYGNASQDTYGYQGGKYVLDAATLGRPEFPTILASLDSNINLVLGTTANRFHQECYYDMLQGFGMLSGGLQKGLLQSVASDAGGEPVIRVFPAWDVAKPAYFRLLAKGGFLVSAAVKNGSVSHVEIVSQLGGTCRLRNPWPDEPVTFYRDGVEASDFSVTAQTLLTFDTATGENIRIVRQGTNLDGLKESIGTAVSDSASNSTVVAAPSSVLADGSATATLTVTLKDSNNNLVAGKAVTVAKTSGPGSPVITTIAGTSNSSGLATFTVKSTTTGTDVFTATDATDGVVLTQTAGVTFIAEGTSSISQTNATGAMGGFGVSATDLVNQGQTTLTSATRSKAPLHSLTTDFGGQDPNNTGTNVPYANDGAIGAFCSSGSSGSAPWGKNVEFFPSSEFAGTQTPASALLPVTYTFALNTPLNPNGYDISGLTSTCGYLWNKDWCANQVFQVEITKDGSTWLNLGSYTYKPYTSPTETGNLVAQVSLSNAGGGALNSGTCVARNVTGIRLTYVDPGNASGGNFNGTAIKEIDVLGQPSTAPPATAYETWTANPAYTGVDLSNPTADADHDGLSNFHEFAFGLNPTKGASANPCTPLHGTQFSYTRRAASGLTYTVEYSTDLTNWNPATVSESPGAADSNGVQTVTVTVSNPALNGKLFVRVKAR